MNAWLKTGLGVVLVATASGCHATIAKNIHKLKVGVTTEEQVRKMLGRPSAEMTGNNPTQGCGKKTKMLAYSELSGFYASDTVSVYVNPKTRLVCDVNRMQTSAF